MLPLPGRRRRWRAWCSSSPGGMRGGRRSGRPPRTRLQVQIQKWLDEAGTGRSGDSEAVSPCRAGREGGEVMDAIFPLGFPPATAFYLTLYVATLVVHVVFMNYVLAGASYLLLASFWGTGCRKACCWQRLIKDWIPFATGLRDHGRRAAAAVRPDPVSAGVLYGESAAFAPVHADPSDPDCLLLHALRPQEPLDSGARTAVQIGARLVVFLGFAFIAWSWTENHLLSLDEGVWRGFYAEGRSFYVATGMSRGWRCGSWGRSRRWRSS